MTEDEAITRFGLPSTRPHKADILIAIEEEMLREQDEEGDQSLLKCLCIQLFSIGDVEDSLIIWRVKSDSFDLMCGVDVQLLCGAGLEVTRQFLTAEASPLAPEALKYLEECVVTGDFNDWTPYSTLRDYLAYYGIKS